MVIKKIKSSYFAKTFNLFKKNLDALFLIFIFDIWFLAVLLLFGKLVEFLARNFLGRQLYSTLPSIIFVFVIYYLIIMLIYSFFKYIVLHYIKKMFEDIKIDFKRFGSFFLLNLIIIISLFIIFSALNGILLLNMKPQVRPFVFLLINIPFIFFSYALINIAHSLFIDLKKTKEILKKTLKITFINIKSYLGIYLISIFVLGIYFSVFYLINFIIRKKEFYYGNFGLFLNIFLILTGIIFYIIIFFNRAYFYLIIKEKFLKNH